jgi:hypothetical protein
VKQYEEGVNHILEALEESSLWCSSKEVQFLWVSEFEEGVIYRGYSEYKAIYFAIWIGVRGSRYLAGDTSALFSKIAFSIKCFFSLLPCK